MIKSKIAIVSGGFDPAHIGHIRMFNEAKKLADKLYVIINNDNWLMNKKGFVFMPEQDRIEIIKNLRDVDFVFLTKHKLNDEDTSVCKELSELHEINNKTSQLIFCNGGDRKADNIPEYDLCKKLKIEMKFNIGGEKLRSSSELVKSAGKK